MEQQMNCNKTLVRNNIRINQIFINKFFSILIILLPFLYQYQSPISFLSLGDFLLIIGSALCIVLDAIYQKNVKIFSPVIFLAIGLLFINFIPMFTGEWYSNADFFTIFLKIIMYTIVIEVAYNHFSLYLIKKIYLNLCLLFSAYLIIQYLYTRITNNYLPIYLKYDWLFSWEKRAESLSDYYAFVYYKFRPSSLFLEPSYFALYVIPGLYLALVFEKKYFLALIASVALLLSTSGAGIGLMAIIYVIFGLQIINKLVKHKKLSMLSAVIFISIIVVTMICLVLFSDKFSRVLGGSFGPRIARGFIIFKDLDLSEKLFGVGINNLSNYMVFANVSTIYDEANLNYAASISSVLVQNGLFGIIVLFSFITMVWKKNKDCISFIILLLALLCFEDVLYNFRFGFYISFLLSIHHEYDILNLKNKKEERGKNAVLGLHL